MVHTKSINQNAEGGTTRPPQRKEKDMKNYEVTIENRKNTIWSNFLGKITMIVAAENKKQAIDFAYEIFQPEYRMSREKVKITAERFEG